MAERRKDYMVSKKVHFFYMLTLVASLLLVGSLVVMAVSLRKTGFPAEHKVELVLVGVLSFVIVCTSLGLAVYTIVQTHRMVGSAYRIGVVLREVKSGQAARIVLREGDFFEEIALEVNDLIERSGGGADAAAPAAPTEASS